MLIMVYAIFRDFLSVCARVATSLLAPSDSHLNKTLARAL